MKVVRSQFLSLAALQHQDDLLRALVAEQQQLPQQLQPYEIACTEAEQKLAHLQADIEQTEQKRRALERALDSSHEHLRKTQSKLRAVKTNKEYSAVLAEIATGKERVATLEDQVLDLMEIIEQHRHSFRIQEQHLHESRETLTAQGRHLQTVQEDLAQQIHTEKTKRQQIVADLDGQIYDVYQKFTTQRSEQTVVQIHDGTCGGCHLKIQPQLVSEIRKQDKLIMCPHCQRILLWPAD